MILSIIVAVSDNNAIGINNQLPWYLPEDLKFFKRTTIGKPVIMGRKTFDSLGRPLPGRLNIVISHQKDLKLPQGVLLYDDLKEATDRVREEQVDEAFVIGGGKIFEEVIPYIDRMYITRVHATIQGADAFFPDIDHSHWKLVWEEKHQADDLHKYSFAFQKYERIDL
ncbi:MAG TPA: dihydrofolate reductase [Flavipsychrobacter sp.]|nr:dihydrofolate reductase [Flavipsychrobacter sp.]